MPEELARHDPKLLDLVCNEVLDTGACISWDDIAGLEHAKELVQELVVWPMLNPHLFTGARRRRRRQGPGHALLACSLRAALGPAPARLPSPSAPEC